MIAAEEIRRHGVGVSSGCEMCALNWYRECAQREALELLSDDSQSVRRACKLWRGAFFGLLLVTAFMVGERLVRQ